METLLQSLVDFLKVGWLVDSFVDVNYLSFSTLFKPVSRIGSVTWYFDPFFRGCRSKRKISPPRPRVYLPGLGFKGVSNRNLSGWYPRLPSSGHIDLSVDIHYLFRHQNKPVCSWRSLKFGEPGHIFFLNFSLHTTRERWEGGRGLPKYFVLSSQMDDWTKDWLNHSSLITLSVNYLTTVGSFTDMSVVRGVENVVDGFLDVGFRGSRFSSPLIVYIERSGIIFLRENSPVCSWRSLK